MIYNQINRHEYEPACISHADVSAEIYEKIYNFWALIFQWTIEQQVPWGFAPSPVI